MLFFFIFKHSRGPKRSWKNFHGVLESPGKVLDFLSVKEWEPWLHRCRVDVTWLQVRQCRSTLCVVLMTCAMTSTLAVSAVCVAVDLSTTKIPTSAVSCADILHRGSKKTVACLILCNLKTPEPILDGQAFYSKTGVWPSYCQISTNRDKILHTPIVVRNTVVGRLSSRSACGRLQAKPERLCFCNRYL